MDIDVKELSERLAHAGEEFRLIDVREPREWTAGHIAGAHHIPLQQVPARMNDIPRDSEVIVYCRTGGRSANAQQFLKANGFTNVRNLLGGITAWKREVDPSMTVV